VHVLLELTNLTGWGVPFLWAGIWTAISIPWIRREMHKEKVTWEMDYGIVPHEKKKAQQMLARGSIDTSDPTKEPEP
jgi:hypothetical protein